MGLDLLIGFRVEQADDAVRLHWIGNHTDVDYTDDLTADVEDHASSHNDEDYTAPLVFDMRYLNAKGETSDRRVRLSRILYQDTAVNFQAWCYMRNRYRTFKLGNVKEIIDVATGEIFDDPHAYFAECGVFEGQSPEARALAVCKDDLAILSLMATCDGNVHPAEIDEIVKHVFSRADEELDEAKIRCVVSQIAPDRNAAQSALKKLRGRDEAKRYVLRSMRRVMDADRLLNESEILLASEIISALG